MLVSMSRPPYGRGQVWSCSSTGWKSLFSGMNWTRIGGAVNCRWDGRFSVGGWSVFGGTFSFEWGGLSSEGAWFRLKLFLDHA